MLSAAAAHTLTHSKKPITTELINIMMTSLIRIISFYLQYF